jgi:HEAT repeat protein
VWSAALEVRAQLDGTSELVELAKYVLANPEASAVLVVHRSGARHETAGQLAKSLDGLGPAGFRARSVLQAHASEARVALELDIYDVDRALQQEALEHLAAYLDISPAAVVLAAMSSRPPAADGIAVQALESLLSVSSMPLGLAVTREASPNNQALINRLLAVFSARIDAARPLMKSADAQRRLSAIAEIGRLAPLSAPELLELLSDPDLRVRRAAARWLALGEGLSVRGLAERRIRAQEVPGPKAWMKVLADSGETGCGSTAVHFADDASLSPALRGDALEALGACEGPNAWRRIRKSLADPSPPLRRGAVAALIWMPLHPEARLAVEAALSDAEPEVGAAAARSAGIPGQQRLIPALSRMLAHPSPLVRSAAAEGLGAIGVADSAMAMAARLRLEPDPSVRRALIHALGALGSPAARASLQECAAADTDPQVRAEAEHALRTAPP